jgi:hypothetical protein
MVCCRTLISGTSAPFLSDFDTEPPVSREELYNLQHSVLYSSSASYGMGLLKVCDIVVDELSFSSIVSV